MLQGVYIPHQSPPAQQYFTSNRPQRHTISHIKQHFTYLTTPPDHTWRDVDSVVRNLGRQLCLIHPNVAVMWNKVRSVEYVRYGVMLHVMSCNVR